MLSTRSYCGSRSSPSSASSKSWSSAGLVRAAVRGRSGRSPMGSTYEESTARVEPEERERERESRYDHRDEYGTHVRCQCCMDCVLSEALSLFQHLLSADHQLLVWCGCCFCLSRAVEVSLSYSAHHHYHSFDYLQTDRAGRRKVQVHLSLSLSHTCLLASMAFSTFWSSCA